MWVQFGEGLSKSVKLGRTRAAKGVADSAMILDGSGLDSNRRAKLVELGPKLAASGPKPGRIGRCQVKFSRFRERIRGIRSIKPILVEIGRVQHRRKFDRSRQNCPRVCPEFGRMWPEIDRFRPVSAGSARICTRLLCGTSIEQRARLPTPHTPPTRSRAADGPLGVVAPDAGRAEQATLHCRDLAEARHDARRPADRPPTPLERCGCGRRGGGYPLR